MRHVIINNYAKGGVVIVNNYGSYDARIVDEIMHEDAMVEDAMDEHVCLQQDVWDMIVRCVGELKCLFMAKKDFCAVYQVLREARNVECVSFKDFCTMMGRTGLEARVLPNKNSGTKTRIGGTFPNWRVDGDEKSAVRLRMIAQKFVEHLNERGYTLDLPGHTVKSTLQNGAVEG